jgi:hypothetical protein
MMIFLAPAVCIIGLVLFAVTANPKAAEIGKVMFWTGLLATLLVFGGWHEVLH